MDNLTAAIEYSNRGWSVIPLETGTKKALVKWKEYQTTRADEAQLRRWWGKWPDANVGIITGDISGFFAVDVDSAEGWEQIQQRGGLPETLHVKTSKIGHFYFECPGESVRNATSLLPGVDIRGNGGLVAAPPSVHSSGVIYEWANDSEIAPAPDWLLELMSTPKSQPMPEINQQHLNGCAGDPDQERRFVEGCVKSEINKINNAPDGAKHDQLLKSSTYLSGYISTGAISADEIEARLFEAIAPRAADKKNALDTIHDGIKHGSARPLQIPNKSKAVVIRGRAVRTMIRGGDQSEIAVIEDIMADEAESDKGGDEDEQAVNDGIYGVLNGRTVLAVQKTKGKETGSEENTTRHFVADFAAYIDGEVRDENGTALYEVQGRTRRGKTFHVELLASKMSDPKYVSGQFLNASGAGTIVYAGMEKHLAPAVHQFTDYKQLRISRRFSRVGWTKDLKEFVIPGMEAPDMTITLDKELAYQVTVPHSPLAPLAPNVADALHALLKAHKPELTTVGLVHALLAPFSALAGWRDEKFALFIAGRTGSFKTSWAAQLMCVYGDFSNEDKLLKFGMGGTANAMMSFTADASDVPLLIDNFKPGTGNGQKDAQNLIHGVLEGGEKKRLNRDGTRRSGKEIHCWPIFTGEDTVEDSASIARTLIVAANWDGQENEGLSAVQRVSHLLPHVGGAWLAWLLTDEAKTVAAYVKEQFYPRRSEWAKYLREHTKDMVNASRVASSLALCECGWEAARACPALAPVLGGYTAAFQAALKGIARSMGSYTAQTHEANRYLAALRAMISTNRAYVVNRFRDFDAEDRRAFLGWEDEEAVYLQPDAAYAEVMKFLRDGNGLNGLGMATIHKQLDQLGHLLRKDTSGFTVLRRVGTESKAQRLLWVRRESVFEEGDETL